jgi:multidrug transporter EmrE-like cation transporter
MTTPTNVIDRVGPWTPRLLRVAAVMTLVGLALMVWSMAQPTPMPVILAMSVGQGVGILAFALFGVVVLIDQLRLQREQGAREALRIEIANTALREAPP